MTMPSSLDGAVRELNLIESVATTTEWKRAGLVWLCCQTMSDAEFAAREIPGLKKEGTVRIYIQAWQDAIDAGKAAEPRWGKTIALPDMPFPRTRTGTDGFSSPKGAAKTIERIQAQHGAGVFVAALKANPQIAVEAAKDPDVAAAIAGDKDSELSVMRAQGAKASARGAGHRSTRAEPMEPFARALVMLNLLALRQDAEAMAKVAMTDFTGAYVWRPGEKEKVLAQLDDVAEIIGNVRTVLTTEVSDDALAEFLGS
jgi:hypothetical protein